MSMSVAFNPVQTPTRSAPRSEEQQQPTPLEKIRETAKAGEEPKTPFKPDAGKDKDEGAPPPRRSGRGLDILV